MKSLQSKSRRLTGKLCANLWQCTDLSSAIFAQCSNAKLWPRRMIEVRLYPVFLLRNIYVTVQRAIDLKMDNLAEFFMGSIAACGACLFTNPLEVVKTRMQLQGELKARGTYSVHYRNVFHAFYTIAKVDGITALQKGLVPALVYQAVMNGVRLGSYQYLMNSGLTRDSEGKLVVWRCILSAAFSGCIGAFAASPSYMVSVSMRMKNCLNM